MSIVKLYPIKLLPRYKVFEYERKHYLVDLENGLITFFFPILSPLFRKKTYCISEEDYVGLKSEVLSTEELKKTATPSFYILVGLPRLVRWLFPDNFGVIPVTWNHPLYLFFLLLVFVVRTFYYLNSSPIKSLLSYPAGKVTLRCRDASGMKAQLLSIVMLLCSIGLSKGILFGDDYNLVSHFLGGFTLLGYFVFALGYYIKEEYKMVEYFD